MNSTITIKEFESEQAFLDEYTNSSEPGNYFGGVQFDNVDTDKDQYQVQFRYPFGQTPTTSVMDFNPLRSSPNLGEQMKWIQNGNIQLFPAVSEFLACFKICKSNSSLCDTIFNRTEPLYLQKIGVAPMQSQRFINVNEALLDPRGIISQFSNYLLIVFLIPIFYITGKMAEEKESKAREGMKMMGLKDATYYCSWITLFTFIMLYTSIVVTVFMIKMFDKSNGLAIFLFNFFYSFTFFGITQICVTILPNKKNASIAVILFNFLTFFLTPMLADPSTSSSLIYGFSIFFPNVVMYKMISQLYLFNFLNQEGLNFTNMRASWNGFNYSNGIIILLAQIVVYTFLGLYLDQIIPSQYGVAKSWNFLCVKKKARAVREQEESLIQETEDSQNFEQVPDSLRRQEQTNECLKIRNLVKTFGTKKAVDGTNLTIYNGQIFALLGHNGAGKTTTISMLTGLLEPTGGKASVFGLDIFNEMEDFRKVLGVCPQHDVLFDFLTPEEHLRLFAAFKGTDPALVEAQVQQMLIDIDLDKQKKQLAKTLSGGQKRKLSVAISMIGTSKIILLDEPTSGMDTQTRRRLWDMLKKNKAGKIIILTTHYMDEADILGDRIAIMAEGKVQCTGSSLFLKNRYGVGYNLVIAKKDRQPAPQIDKFVLESIKGAKKLQEVSSEIAYQLPTESSSQFKQFFADFDKNQDQLGIRSYSVGITTLEEVFLKIGHGEELEAAKLEQRNALNPSTQIMDSQQIELEEYSIANDSEKNPMFQQIYVMMRKKVLMLFRDKKTLAVDLILPNLFIILGFWLATIDFFRDGPALNLNPNLRYEMNTLWYNNNSNYNDINIAEFVDNYLKPTFQSVNPNLKESIVDITLEGMNVTQQAAQVDEKAFLESSSSPNLSNSAAFFIKDLKRGEGRFYSAIALVNSTSSQITGSYTSFLSIAFLKKYLMDSLPEFSENSSFDPSTANFTYIHHPMPKNKQLAQVGNVIGGFSTAFMITIAYTMISSSQISSIISERQKNIKHQIMVSGSSYIAYWIGTYLGDIIFQAIPCLIAIIGVQIFNLEVPQVWVLFLINLLANPVFVYALSFLFKRDDGGSNAIKGIYFVFGVIAPIILLILQIINDKTRDIANSLRWCFLPFPIFSLVQGYQKISLIGLVSSTTKTNEISSFNKDFAGYNLIFLLSSIFFYWIIIACFEMKVFDYICFCRCIKRIGKTRNELFGTHGFSTDDQDEDIQEETQRVINGSEDQPTRVLKVQKNFGNVQAVKKISFGLEFGECFALLGVSGAGKTTLFKCLTGEIYPSSGEINICGFDVTSANGFAQARKQIGYCPQFDCIFDNVTVKEHLEIYATLKGIKQNIRQRLIEKAIEEMDLKDFENVFVNNLSGGNKRKLSVAIAIIGNPPLVFLDEPSTGVDPQAKRFMWNILSKISTLRKKSAVIITTHSMEEAEALCTKMGIMVAGEFKCFGSSTHIKDKYGTGYELEVKIRTLTEEEVQSIIQQNQKFLPFNLQSFSQFLKQNENEDLIEEISATGNFSDIYDQLSKGEATDPSEFIKWQFTEQQGHNAIEFLEPMFKEFQILEHYGSSWKLKVSRDNYSIGYLFGMMEDNQKKFNISEYSVTQTTLEQIFVSFATQADGRKSTMRRKSSVKKTTKPIQQEYKNE